MAGNVVRKKSWLAGVVGISVLAVLLTVAAQAGSSERASGGAVVHRNGRVVGGSAPAVKTYSVGHMAMEPTVAIDRKGAVFYAAAGFDVAGGNLASTEIMRSRDAGVTWEFTTPRVLGQKAPPTTLDPYVYVDDIDKKHSRVFTIDLTVACSFMSFSDDQGKTWTTNPLACGRPVNDHQTLFSGPPVSSPTVGYPNVLYYCWNDVGSSACSKSLDGGITFHPTGSPAFAGFDPNGSQGPGFFGVSGFCGGLHGHGAVGPDGTVYLPREYCGRPMLAISRDEGRTWTQVDVSKIPSTAQPGGGTGHPSVAVDSKGNVYYLWISNRTRLPLLSVSKNHGKTWSDPIEVALPEVNEANLPQITAGGPGKITFVYYGSTNSPFEKCKDECEASKYAKTTWNGYLSMSVDALSADPTFMTGRVSDPKEPLVRGQCGPGRCQWVFDFIDVEIGEDGVPYGAFVDGCMDDCQVARGDKYEGLVTKLVGGARLN